MIGSGRRRADNTRVSPGSNQQKGRLVVRPLNLIRTSIAPYKRRAYAPRSIVINVLTADCVFSKMPQATVTTQLQRRTDTEY